jgi:uncharacterized protein YfcZ (UPF0381/DUF406 family)
MVNQPLALSRKKPFDVSQIAETETDSEIERQIARLGPVDFAPPKVRLPEDISHKDGVGEVGRLSAEAVLAEYEQAARSVEAMGEDVKERIRRLEAALLEADADLKTIAEAARDIREKGKLIFVQIEEASSVSNEIRTTCTEFRKKVGHET